MPVTCAHLSVSSFSQHFVCLPLSVELALLALSTSQYFVYLPLSIQRLQARSKYIHVCSGAPSLAHKACTRYTERPNLRCWLPAPSSQLSALSSQLSALGSRLSAPSSQLPAPSSQLPALNFPNNNPSKTESRYLDIFAF